MTLRRLEVAFAVVAVALAALVVSGRYAVEHAEHAADYVTYTRGDLPIVLVVPHDGDAWHPSVPARAEDPRRDHGTLALAEAIADRTAGMPHVIALRMDRRQLDVNRPPDTAFEHADAKDVYEAFHARVAQTVRACGNPRCVVLDLHGNWEFPADVYLGARRAPVEARLREAVQAAGFAVATREETPATLRGDHITSQYGRWPGIEAVMVEVHERIRTDAAARDRLAAAIALALGGTP